MRTQRSPPLAGDIPWRVVLGQLPGFTSIIIRGMNPSIAAAAGFDDIWTPGGNLTYLAVAERMDLVSTDATDTDAAGTGARTVMVAGVDGTGAALVEVLSLAGLVPVQTVGGFLRVNTLTIVDVGTNESNAGVITATATVAATTQCQIPIGASLSFNSQFTVPLEQQMFLLQVEFNVARIAGGSAPVVEFRGEARPTGSPAPFFRLFDKRMDADVTDELDVFLPVPTVLPPRTDIRLVCDTDQNDTIVSSRMIGVLAPAEA